VPKQVAEMMTTLKQLKRESNNSLIKQSQLLNIIENLPKLKGLIQLEALEKFMLKAKKLFCLKHYLYLAQKVLARQALQAILLTGLMLAF